MAKTKPINKADFDKIMSGIDKTKHQHKDGWWDTPEQAVFGTKKKQEIWVRIKKGVYHKK